jgi:hypothetical protein
MPTWDSGHTYDSGVLYDSEEVGPPPSESNHYQDLTAMRQLINFFSNPFESSDISLAEESAFTTDLVGNLQNDNPLGVHDARITALTSAYSTVETCLGADLAALGTRKARKTAKNLFRDGLPDATARIEIALKAAFGPNAAQVQQAFPSGRTLFGKSPDDLLGAAIGVMNSVVAANAASLTPAIVTLSAGQVTGWAAVYTQSEAASAVKTHSVTEKRAARKALQRELYLTLVHLMVTYPLQPDKLEHYMKQHLLEDHPAAPDEDEPEEEAPPVEA